MAKEGQHKAKITLQAQVDAADKELKKYIRSQDKMERQITRLQKKLDGQAKALDKTQSATERAADAYGKVTKVLGAAGLTAVVAGAIKKLDEWSAQTLKQQNVIGNLAVSIDKARAATGGLISTYDLAVSANTNMRLDVVKTDAEFAKLAELSAKLGQTIGLDATDALDQFSEALSKSSILRLDNLGITFKVQEANERYAAQLGITADQLTDAQKKQIFVSEAMRLGEEKTKNITLATESGAAAMQRFKIQIVEAGDALKQELSESVGQTVDAGQKLVGVFGEAGILMQQLAGKTREQAQEQGLLNKAYHGTSSAIGAITGFDFADTMDKISEGSSAAAKEMKRFSESLDDAQGEMLSFKSEAQKLFSSLRSPAFEKFMSNLRLQQKVNTPSLEVGVSKVRSAFTDMVARSSRGLREKLNPALQETNNILGNMFQKIVDHHAKKKGGGRRDNRSLLERELEAFTPDDAAHTAGQAEFDALLLEGQPDPFANEQQFREQELERQRDFAERSLEVDQERARRRFAEEKKLHDQLLAQEKKANQARLAVIKGAADETASVAGGVSRALITNAGKSRKAQMMAVAGFLQAKAIENTVIGITELTRGIALAASPFTAALAPPHFAASAKAFASAAVIGGLGVGLGAAGGQFSGGGGGRTTSFPSDSPGPSPGTNQSSNAPDIPGSPGASQGAPAGFDGGNSGGGKNVTQHININTMGSRFDHEAVENLQRSIKDWELSGGTV